VRLQSLSLVCSDLSSASAVRWDPNRKDPAFLDQSAILWAAYYQLQITIHRPFIKKRVSVANVPRDFTALAICTNAARACARVIETHMMRLGSIIPTQIVRPFPHSQMQAGTEWQSSPRFCRGLRSSSV
jgi:hypothetical protein